MRLQTGRQNVQEVESFKAPNENIAATSKKPKPPLPYVYLNQRAISTSEGRFPYIRIPTR